MEQEMLNKMLVLAATKHDGQFDKGGRPYILHPLAVMNLLEPEVQNSVVHQVVAVGHDLLEDTDTTTTDLKELGFSKEVIDAILALTKMPGQSYNDYKKAVLNNKIARKVKKADLRHNSDLRRLKGVSEKDIDRAAKYMKFFYEIESVEKATGL